MSSPREADGFSGAGPHQGWNCCVFAAIVGGAGAILLLLFAGPESQREREMHRRFEAFEEEQRLWAGAEARPLPFDAEAWRAEPGDTRILMAMTMVEGRVLEGLTRAELTERLGDPTDATVRWRFYVGTSDSEIDLEFYWNLEDEKEVLHGRRFDPRHWSEFADRLESMDPPSIDELRRIEVAAWEQHAPAWRLRALQRISESARAGEVTAREFDTWPIAAIGRQESWEYHLNADGRWFLSVTVDRDGVVGGANCFQSVYEY